MLQCAENTDVAALTFHEMKSALASLDMCQLGATAVTALKTLPQGTKGRAFAEMVRSADFSGGDLSQLKNLSSF